MTLCFVCENNDGKYKCPKCRQKYCSVACCKKHKEDVENCVSEESKVTETTDTVEKQQPNYVTEDTVPQNHLQQLSSSKDLVDMLKIPDLQSILVAINNSTQPDIDLQRAMQQDNQFLKFANQCLKVIEPNQQSTQEMDKQKVVEFISDQFNK